MLHAIAGENFDASVVKQHGNVHGELAGGRAQNLAHPVVEPEPPRGLIEARGSRQPRILFVFQRSRNRWCEGRHVASGSIMTVASRAAVLRGPQPPRTSSALRITGSRCASTSSPFSTPSAWLTISVFSRFSTNSRSTDHSATPGWICRSESQALN